MRDGKQYVILCKQCEIDILSCTNFVGTTADKRFVVFSTYHLLMWSNSDANSSLFKNYYFKIPFLVCDLLLHSNCAV